MLSGLHDREFNVTDRLPRTGRFLMHVFCICLHASPMRRFVNRR